MHPASETSPASAGARVHPPAPEHATPKPAEHAGSFLGMRSDETDSSMSALDLEQEIEMSELREVWFEQEGLHSHAQKERETQARLIAGRHSTEEA